MSEGMIIALLSFAGTALGTAAGILTSGRLVEYRLSALEEKVEKHNRLVERTYALEGRVSAMEQRAGQSPTRAS